LSGFAAAALPPAGARGLHVQSASWFTKFAVLVQLGLSPTTVADGSPLIGQDTRTIELVIRNIAGVPERSFRWER
jgi:hypothetical protein